MRRSTEFGTPGRNLIGRCLGDQLLASTKWARGGLLLFVISSGGSAEKVGCSCEPRQSPGSRTIPAPNLPLVASPRAFGTRIDTGRTKTQLMRDRMFIKERAENSSSVDRVTSCRLRLASGISAIFVGVFFVAGKDPTRSVHQA